MLNFLKINTEFVGFLKNSGWLLFDRLMRLLLGVLVGAWVARYLGPESYGKLAYVFALLAFCQVMVGLGLDSLVVREISRDQEKAAQMLGTTLVLRVICGLVIWVVGSAVVWWVTDNQTATLFVLCAAGLAFQSADTVDLWFQSRSRSKRTVISKLCAYGISSAAKIVCIIVGASLGYFAFIVSFEALLTAAILFVAYRGDPLKGLWKFELSRVVPMLLESWPILLSSLAIIAYLKVDQLMIGHLVGEGALGVYYTAVTLTSLCYFIPVMLNVSAAPFIHRLAGNDDARFEHLMKQYFFAILVIGVVIVVLLYCLAEPLVMLLYGAEYRAAVEVVKVHSLAIIFVFLGSAQNNWLIARRQANQMLYRSIVAIAMGVLLNLWLIPTYGLVGGALSFVIASAVGLFLSNFFINRELFRAQITCFSVRKYKA